MSKAALVLAVLSGVVIIGVALLPRQEIDPGATTTSTTTTLGGFTAGGGEGEPNLVVHAKTAFDPWTADPDPAMRESMRELYELMIVYSPYFDDRLDWYPDGLVYIDLYAIYTDLEKDRRSVDHPDWILNDSNGERLYIDWGCEGGTCPQWAADVGNEDFRTDFIGRVADLVARGYRGVLIDDVNLLWRISDGTGETVEPVDPRTGEVMPLERWREYVVELLEQIRAEFPDIEIMHNSIWYADSPQHQDELVRRQVAAADWIMLERGATDSGLTDGSGRYSLSSLFDFVDMVHELGGNVLFLDETATTVEEQIYNLASYLLVNDGDDLVTTEDYPLIAPDGLWEGFSLDLGDALGLRYRWEGVWRRDFSDGVVLVNDPGAREVSVGIEGDWVSLDGQDPGEIRLDGSAAAILVVP